MKRDAEGTFSLLLVLCAAELLLVLDSTAVNLALVPLGQDLGLTPSSLAWAVNAYGLALAGLLLVGGRIADVVGRRRAFLVGTLLFAAGCCAAAVAEGAVVLLTARFVQGAAAALVMPAAMGLLATGFPEGRERAKALSAWAAVSAIGGTAGVVVSGSVSQHVSWRAVFLALLGLALALLPMGWRLLPPDAVRERRPLNVTGSVVATSALFAVVYCVQSATTLSVLTWAVPVVLVLALVVSELRSSSPLVLQLLRANGHRTAGVLAQAVASTGFSGGLFLLLLTLQEGWGWDAARTGLAFLPFGLAMLLGSAAAPRLLRRMSGRAAWTVGFVVSAAGMAWLALADRGSFPLLLPGWVLLPFGGGCLFVLVTTRALEGVGEAEASQLGAVLAVAQQVGGAVGVAAVAASFGHVTASASFLVGAGVLLVSGLLLPRLATRPQDAPTRQRRDWRAEQIEIPESCQEDGKQPALHS